MIAQRVRPPGEDYSEVLIEYITALNKSEDFASFVCFYVTILFVKTCIGPVSLLQSTFDHTRFRPSV